MASRCRIFVSYAHADEALKESLSCPDAGYPRAFKKHLDASLPPLNGLVRSDEIFFDVQRLAAEPLWNAAIKQALSECELFIFLVSVNSLTSEFCLKQELARAVKRAVPVIPVLLKPKTDWIHHPVPDPDDPDVPLAHLGDFHSGGLPKDGGGNAKAVSHWDSEDEAWDAVCNDIQTFIKTNLAARARPSQREAATASTGTIDPHSDIPEQQIQDTGATLWETSVKEARHELEARFDSRALVKLFDVKDSGLPTELDKAFADTTPANLGYRCVNALISLQKAASARLQDGSAALGNVERSAAREELLACMGIASRLCIDPEKLCLAKADLDGGLKAIVELPASSTASAALATGLDRSKSWKEGTNPFGVPTLVDARTHEVHFETGEGADRKKALSTLVHRIVAPAQLPPAEIDKRAQRELRAYLLSEAAEGRAHILALFEELSPEARNELEGWIRSNLGISLLLIREPDADSSPYYLCDELNVLARIREFLKLLSQPEWNPS